MIIDWCFGRKAYKKARWKRAAWRGIKQILKDTQVPERITIII